MSALVVDTSAWIRFFEGETIPPLEEALREARVVLTPIVLAELMSGVETIRARADLLDFLGDLHLHLPNREHWVAVGDMRRRLKRRGIRISTPDAHIAQCAIDLDAQLISYDHVFAKAAVLLSLHLIA